MAKTYEFTEAELAKAAARVRERLTDAVHTKEADLQLLTGSKRAIERARDRGRVAVGCSGEGGSALTVQTIALINGKGGAGKTTACMMLGLALAEAGYQVAISDRDEQGTASAWLARLRADAGKAKLPELLQRGGAYHFVIIDTPPLLQAPQVRDAIREAGKILLISSPSPADEWTTAKSAAFILSHVTKKQKARLLFNQVQTGTVLGENLDAAAERIGMAALKNYIRRRQAYQHAAVGGWGEGLTERAREEVLMLAHEVMSL